MRFALLLPAMALLCLGLLRQTQAATLSPDSITLLVQPGQITHQTISFENYTDFDEQYSLNLQGVAFTDLADELSFNVLDKEYASWIGFDQQTITILPHAREEVIVSVTVPEDADEKLLTFAVIATKQSTAQTGVGIAQGMASIFFVEIGNQLESKLQLESFASVPTNQHRLPLRLAALVSNQGEGLLAPELVVIIKNVWGTSVDTISLNPTARRLPGFTQRVFSETWQGNPWRFGPYTADLYLISEGADATHLADMRVVLFSWRILSILALLIACLLGGTYAFLHRRRA